MRKILAFCFKTDKAAMRTALVVPITVVFLGLILEFSAGISHVISFIICAAVGVTIAVVICAASGYYHKHYR